MWPESWALIGCDATPALHRQHCPRASVPSKLVLTMFRGNAEVDLRSRETSLGSWFHCDKVCLKSRGSVMSSVGVQCLHLCKEWNWFISTRIKCIYFWWHWNCLYTFQSFTILIFSCEAQLNKCTFLSVCLSVSNRKFSLFEPLMTAYDNLCSWWQLMTADNSIAHRHCT